MMEMTGGKKEPIRVTIAKLILIVLVCGIVFHFISAILHMLPSPRWLGGEVHLGLLVGLLDIPILPALFFWQWRMSRRPEGAAWPSILLLTLCYLAWFLGLIVTFRAIFSGLGIG